LSSCSVAEMSRQICRGSGVGGVANALLETPRAAAISEAFPMDFMMHFLCVWKPQKMSGRSGAPVTRILTSRPIGGMND
jgi:hypothetical protein